MFHTFAKEETICLLLCLFVCSFIHLCGRVRSRIIECACAVLCTYPCVCVLLLISASLINVLYTACTPLIYTILIVQCRTFHIYVIDVLLWFQTTAFGSSRNRTVTLYGYRSSIALTMFARTISDFLSIEKLHPSVGFVCKIMNVVICVYAIRCHRTGTKHSFRSDFLTIW